METPFHSLEVTSLPVVRSQEQSNQQSTTTNHQAGGGGKNFGLNESMIVNMIVIRNLNSR